MRSIFIAATGQHVGKTTIALGLLAALRARGVKCQYFKPVGQHFAEHGGRRADEDAWLCRAVMGSQVDAELMSPVTVPEGFVTEYLQHPDCRPLRNKIMEAQRCLRTEAEMLVVEGTGHAGVGSCLDLSNAAVAAMLDAAVIIVVPGGVGRSLDEVALSLTLFRNEGVPMAGVVANKVYREKYDKVSQALRIGLERLGTRLVGTIPYEPELAFPTVSQICEELEAEVLCGKECLDRIVENTIIAAMTPQNVLSYLRPGSLVITPGDRVDNILLAISADKLDPSGATRSIVGVVLTGGLSPHPALMPLLENSRLPVLFCREDTYSVSARISQRVFKINPGDTEKIEAAQRFVRDYVDIDAILQAIGEEKRGRPASGRQKKKSRAPKPRR